MPLNMVWAPPANVKQKTRRDEKGLIVRARLLYDRLLRLEKAIVGVIIFVNIAVMAKTERLMCRRRHEEKDDWWVDIVIVGLFYVLVF